ncbi:MAG: hypothetical protein QNJ90_04540 [Planctomycetota bacterium]|nr:hypothetical protein [Planctomycetota bacterium]
MIVLALPDYDALPAPLWLLTVLHVLTLSLHFAAMGCLFGGLLTLFGARLPGGLEHPCAKRLVTLFPSLMAATVTLGVAPLLFAQLVYGRVLYSAAIVSGWFWLGIPIMAMLAYACLYAAAFTKQGVGRVRLWLLLALAGLVYVSLTYSSVFSLAERPDAQKTYYEGDASGLVWHPDVTAWIMRWLHMLGGTLTIGGFFFGVLGRRDEAARHKGQFFFLVGTGAAFLTGMVYLFTLGDLLKPFMKSAGIYSLTFGIVAALIAVPLYLKQRLWLSGLSLGLGLLGMVHARHVVRDLRLEGHLDPAAMTVDPQWGLFALFAVCLLVALAAVAWMLRLFFRADAAGA